MFSYWGLKFIVYYPKRNYIGVSRYSLHMGSLGFAAAGSVESLRLQKSRREALYFCRRSDANLHCLTILL